MFIIIKSKANANPNGNEIAAHCGQDGYKEQDRKQQVSEGRWREGKSSAPLVGVQTGEGTRHSLVELPQKLQNTSTIWSSYSSAACLSKEIGNTTAQRSVQRCVHHSLPPNMQDMEVPLVPITGPMEKEGGL